MQWNVTDEQGNLLAIVEAQDAQAAIAAAKALPDLKDKDFFVSKRMAQSGRVDR